MGNLFQIQIATMIHLPADKSYKQDGLDIKNMSICNKCDKVKM